MTDPTIEEMAIDYALRSGWSESGKECDTAESTCIKKAYQDGANRIAFMTKGWFQQTISALGNGETYDGLAICEFAVKQLNKLMGIEEKQDDDQD